MSQHFESLLDELSSALGDRDFQRAGEIMTDLRSQFDSRQVETQQQANLSRAFLQSGGQQSIDELRDVTELWQASSTTRMTRVLVLVIANAIVEGHEELPDDELNTLIDGTRAAIDDLLNAESQLEESQSSAETTIEQSELPPSVSFVSTAVDTKTPTVDEQTTLTITGENVGESAAAGVSVVLSARGNLDISPEEFDIGTVSAGQTFERTAEVTGHGAGRQTLEADMNSENAGSDFSVVSLAVQDSQDSGVGSQDDQTGDDDSGSSDDGSTGDGSGDGFGSGFGIGGALASLSGAGYLLKRRLETDEDSEE